MSNGSTTLSQECDSLTTHASRHPSYDVSLYNVRVQIYALPEQWCCVERDILVSKQWCCVERYILVSKQYHRGNMKHHAKGLGRDALRIHVFAPLIFIYNLPTLPFASSFLLSSGSTLLSFYLQHLTLFQGLTLSSQLHTPFAA